MASRAELFDGIFEANSQSISSEKISEVEGKVERWERYLAERPGDKTSEKMLKKFERQLKELKRCPENLSLLKKVENLPFVKNVDVNRSRAILETEEIVLGLNQEIVNVGSYLIEFRKNGELPNIKRKQGTVRTKSSGGRYHHPHISDGYVCWSHQKDVMKMLDDAVIDKRPDIIATVAWEMLRKPTEGIGYVSGVHFLRSINHPPPTPVRQRRIDEQRRQQQFELAKRRLMEWFNVPEIMRFLRFVKRKLRI